MTIRSNGNSWTDIAGETNATYTTGKTTIDMSGTQYRCVVKNSIDEVTSDAALLTVKHNLVKTEYKAPTCTVDGNTEYWTCDSCGKYFSDANGDTEIEKDSWIISEIGHDWNDAVYTWSDDGSTCIATRTCKNDSTHAETATATVTGAQTKAPTCTQMGETTYTATFEADWAATQTKVLADIPATGHKYENGKCTVCGALDPNYKPDTSNPTPTPVPAPTIVSGAEASWRKGSGVGLTFTSDANFAGFQGVMVDGTAISAEHYTAKAGSTVVTLKASYLETLSIGTHTVAIVSDTGTAGARFTIVSGTGVPQTGDNSNLALWMGLLGISSVALAGSFLVKRKRKQ